MAPRHEHVAHAGPRRVPEAQPSKRRAERRHALARRRAPTRRRRAHSCAWANATAAAAPPRRPRGTRTSAAAGARCAVGASASRRPRRRAAAVARRGRRGGSPSAASSRARARQRAASRVGAQRRQRSERAFARIVLRGPGRREARGRAARVPRRLARPWSWTSTATTRSGARRWRSTRLARDAQQDLAAGAAGVERGVHPPTVRRTGSKPGSGSTPRSAKVSRGRSARARHGTRRHGLPGRQQPHWSQRDIVGGGCRHHRSGHVRAASDVHVGDVVLQACHGGDEHDVRPGQVRRLRNAATAHRVFDITAPHRGMATLSMCPCQWPVVAACALGDPLRAGGDAALRGDRERQPVQVTRRPSYVRALWRPPDLQEYGSALTPGWRTCSTPWRERNPRSAPRSRSGSNSSECTPAFYRAGGHDSDPGSVSAEGFGRTTGTSRQLAGRQPDAAARAMLNSCFHPFRGVPRPSADGAPSVAVQRRRQRTSAPRTPAATAGGSGLEADQRPGGVRPLVAFECVNGDNGCNGTGERCRTTAAPASVQRRRRRVAAVAVATRLLPFSRGRAQNTARPPPTAPAASGSPPSSATKTKVGTASVCSNVTKPNQMYEALGLLGVIRPESRPSWAVCKVRVVSSA